MLGPIANSAYNGALIGGVAGFALGANQAINGNGPWGNYGPVIGVGQTITQLLETIPFTIIGAVVGGAAGAYYKICKLSEREDGKPAQRITRAAKRAFPAGRNDLFQHVS